MAKKPVPIRVVAERVLGHSTPRIVAVDGPAASGKTTFTSRLVEHLGDVTVVSVDDFLYWGEIERWWPRLEREALGPLMRGRPARYRARDWAGDPLGRGLGAWRELDAADTVLVEGVGSSRKAIADDLAASFWVEAPASERLRRGVQRDGEAMRSRWVEWMRIEDEFFAADRTRERATFVVFSQHGTDCPPGVYDWSAGETI